MSSVTKAELHRLVDQLPDQDTAVSEALAAFLRVWAVELRSRPVALGAPAESVRELRDRLGAQRILIPDDGGAWLAELADGRLAPVDPLLQALYSAPLDDEPWTADDEAAMAEVRADRAAGLVAEPWADVEARLFGAI